MDVSSSGRTVLVPDDVRTAIEQLSDADWIRLRKAANHFARICSADWQELLQEALARTLGDTRHCPTDVSMAHHIVQTMRSVANSWVRKSAGDPLRHSQLIRNDAGEEAGSFVQPPELTDGRTPERALAAERLLSKLYEALEDDEVCGLVLIGRLDGSSPETIQRDVGISKTEYATVLRRLRRRCDKLLNEENAT